MTEPGLIDNKFLLFYDPDMNNTRTIKKTFLTKTILVILLSIFLLTPELTFAKTGKSPYYPKKGKHWEHSSPERSGFISSQLKEAVEFALNNEYSGSQDLRIEILKSFSTEPYIKIVGPVKKRGGPAGVILKGGYIISEWGELNRVDMTFSVTKSYLSTIAGLAVDLGLIRDVNDKLVDYIWDGTFEGKHNSGVTWDHLLTQSSDWSGTLFGKKDWADRPPAEGGLDDWKMRKFNTPGTVFKYNDVRVNVLAYSLLQVWRKPLPVILKEKIMDPIGASQSWRWFGYSTSWINVDGTKVQSVSGGGHSGGGIFINTLDHARYGLLFLRRGIWEGKQLISKEWIKRVQNPSFANPGYGYMWWLNSGGNRKMDGVPSSVYYAAGFGGNYIVIDEANDIVIITRWLEPAKLGDFLRIFYKSLK